MCWRDIMLLHFLFTERLSWFALYCKQQHASTLAINTLQETWFMISLFTTKIQRFSLLQHYPSETQSPWDFSSFDAFMHIQWTCSIFLCVNKNYFLWENKRDNASNLLGLLSIGIVLYPTSITNIPLYL